MLSNYLNLKDRLSMFRQPLMGFAIIWVFMLHSGKTGNSILDAIKTYGWAGVDIFLFLSAVGLCYSLNNNSNVVDFYKRRAIRILPTWIIVLLLVHLLGIICNYFLPNLPFYVPDTIIKCLTWYTGIGFWISDFVTGKGWYYEWYIPSLLAFYLITPLLYKKKSGVLLLLLCSFVAIGYLFHFYKLLPHLHFFYLRIPIFICGLLYYRLITVYNNVTFKNAIITSSIMGLIIIGCNMHFNAHIPKEHLVLFLCPPFLLVLSYLINNKYIMKLFEFYGSISLELYLIHLYRRPNYIVSFIFENKILIVIVAFILCTFAAVMLQRIVTFVLKQL